VEIVLFLVLLLSPQNDTTLSTQNDTRFYIIRAAILGSILATMLLCLGACFFAAGARHVTATFDGAISEVGTGLLLMA
jgi:Ca2+:H+ antiporter